SARHQATQPGPSPIDRLCFTLAWKATSSTWEPKPEVIEHECPGPTVFWQFHEATATSYSDAPLNMWGSNLNQAFANFWKNFYTCPQLAALTMKATKERFSRFHLLRLRRQSTTFLLVNLFFKTICWNRRIKSRRPVRVLAALLAWLSLGPFAAYATDFFWHTPSGGDWGFNGNWSGGPHPETFSDT